ncbi:MAG TPA: 8-oxo-dGTP diphosphatase [Anaerolineae bacterium]
MRDATLVFLVRGHPQPELLLGMKNRGFGSGKYNGFGGKVESGETIENAAVRELSEECGITVSVSDLIQAARLEFFFPAQPDWNQVVHVFLAERWRGEPAETGEMTPAWFGLDAIPYEQMWADDPYWLPLVLRGEFVEATFTFRNDNETIDTLNLLRK